MLVLAQTDSASPTAITPAQAAETLRATLFQTQLQVTSDPAAAQAQVAQVVTLYDTKLTAPLAQGAAATEQRIQAGLAAAQEAVKTGDANALAVARAQVWTGVLDGAQQLVFQAITAGDIATAQQWLAVREFRSAGMELDVDRPPGTPTY